MIAARGVGQRQQNDQHVGHREHPVEALGAMEAGDAAERLFARTPAGDPEAERAELQRGVCAEDTEAEHADLDLGRLRLIVVVRPQALALLALVAAQLA